MCVSWRHEHKEACAQGHSYRQTHEKNQSGQRGWCAPASKHARHCATEQHACTDSSSRSAVTCDHTHTHLPTSDAIKTMVPGAVSTARCAARHATAYTTRRVRECWSDMQLARPDGSCLNSPTDGSPALHTSRRAARRCQQRGCSPQCRPSLVKYKHAGTRLLMSPVQQPGPRAHTHVLRPQASRAAHCAAPRRASCRGLAGSRCQTAAPPARRRCMHASGKALVAATAHSFTDKRQQRAAEGTQAQVVCRASKHTRCARHTRSAQQALPHPRRGHPHTRHTHNTAHAGPPKLLHRILQEPRRQLKQKHA